MNILANFPHSLFEASTKKNYTGPLHFSSMLLKSFEKSEDRFTGLVFEKTKPHPGTYFKSRIVKQGKNQWLILNIWIPTVKIINSKRKIDPDTAHIVEQIKKALLKAKVDLFFLNGFSALTFLIMQAAHQLKIPAVSTHHGLWLKEYMALRKDLIKSSIKYRKELERDTVRYSEKNIFLSKLSLREFEKHLIKVPKNQLEFIKIPYNPVFLNKSYPKPNTNANLNILMVGRWDAVKNHEAYLKLAKRAKELNLPWTFYSVCNIGPYPHHDDIREDYEKYIKVLPAMPAEKLKKMYEMSNITILPSHFDVYPGVITETILQNRPALISENVGWVDEFRKHGIKHWIVDFKNPDKVISRIKKVSTEQIPKSLYNEVLKYNNPEYVFKQYYKLFHLVHKQNTSKK